jgi:hypothetical protein
LSDDPGASIAAFESQSAKDFHRKIFQKEKIETNDLRNENFLAKQSGRVWLGSRQARVPAPQGLTPRRAP